MHRRQTLLSEKFSHFFLHQRKCIVNQPMNTEFPGNGNKAVACRRTSRFHALCFTYKHAFYNITIHSALSVPVYNSFIMLTIPYPNSMFSVIMAVNQSTLNESTVVPCTEAYCLRHPHWQQFEDEAYGVHVSIGLVMAVVCFLSVIGNGFVIYVYTR